MAGFFDPPDNGNPFALAPAQTLGMMLSGLGSGITAASARNLPAYYGIAPGAQAFENSYNNLLTRGANYDLANKNYQLNASYKNMQEKQLELQSEALRRQFGFQDAFMKAHPELLGGAGGAGAASSGAPPGFRPQRTLLGPGDYSDITAGTESGGRYDAVNPTSGATGKFQFMPDTWTNVAAFHPELGLPMDVRKATPQQQEAAMQAFTADNAKFLTAHGVSPTPSNLYLAHRFGAQGAVNFLSADDSAPVASVVPPSWVAQNPDLRGVTVGQFKAGVGQRYGGAGAGGMSPGMPQMPGPPPDTSAYAMGALGGPQFGAMTTALGQNIQNQYKYQWQAYNAEVEAQKLRQQIANGDLIPGPNGTWVPNTAKAEAAGAAAAATKQIPQVRDAFKNVPQDELEAMPSAERAAYEGALASGNAKDAAAVLSKFEGGIPWQYHSLTGEAFVSKMSPAIQALLRGLKNGNISVQDLPSRAASVGVDSSKINLMAMAQHAYGDDFDASLGSSRRRFENSLADGDNAKTLQAFSVAIPHMRTYWDLFQAQKNGNQQAINGILNALRAQYGNDKVPSAQAAAHLLATEIAKSIGGEVTVSGQAAMKDLIDSDLSNPQTGTLLKTLAEMGGARFTMLQDRARYYKMPESAVKGIMPDRVANDLAYLQGHSFGQQAQGPSAPQPPAPPSADAINYLKMNPKLRDKFDEKYGAGAAAKVLGQ